MPKNSNKHPENDPLFKNLSVNEGVDEVPTTNPYQQKKQKRKIYSVSEYIYGILNGDISMEYALKRLSEHQPNNQICIISQNILDDSLHFISAEPLNDLARKEVKSC